MFYKIQACFKGFWFGLCAAVISEEEAKVIEKKFSHLGLQTRIIKTEDLC